MDASGFVRWFHRETLPRAIVGGKAASLSEMLSWRLPVPLGFAITADAYCHFETAPGLKQKLDALTANLDARDADAVQYAAAEARAATEAAALPQDVSDA